MSTADFARSTATAPEATLEELRYEAVERSAPEKVVLINAWDVKDYDFNPAACLEDLHVDPKTATSEDIMEAMFREWNQADEGSLVAVPLREGTTYCVPTWDLIDYFIQEIDELSDE